MDKNYTVKAWPILYTYDEINWDIVNSCNVVAETDNYILYQRTE